MLDVFREEKKYVCNLLEAVYLKNTLCGILQGDPFQGYEPYTVRSLYFDSISDKDYREKEDGLSERKKVRIRIYSPDDKKAKLELKQKSGCMQRKQSLSISREHALELINGNYEVLKEYDGDFALYMYNLMTLETYRPKTVIEYDRVAFTAPINNIRLTVDSGVRANEGYFNIFDKDIFLYPVINPASVIFEVKYNKFLLSYIKDAIRCVCKIETSASKYTMSRCIGQGGE
ncbi:MAG: polyphosphate polymerase domain-containing protein [Butyrivibrio sp.]|nr:polyphosphate polymerase domain-containing protein [Butyrivibrio sp.]